jgi:hypothetical protein
VLEGIGAIGGAFLIATAAGSALAKPSQKGRRRTARQGRHAIAPSVVAAFAQNPNGGPGLTAALHALLIQEPGLAAEVVAEARGASASRRSAAGEALAEARQAFSPAGNRRAATQIGGRRRSRIRGQPLSLKTPPVTWWRAITTAAEAVPRAADSAARAGQGSAGAVAAVLPRARPEP